MRRKVIFIFCALYGLMILQMSFFVHFFPAGFVPNMVVIFVVLLNIVDRSDSALGVAVALFGGFLLDIFSGHFIGLWIGILLVISLLMKIVLADYVRFPILKRF